MTIFSRSPARSNPQPSTASDGWTQLQSTGRQGQAASSTSMTHLPVELVEQVIDSANHPRALLSLMRTNKAVHRLVAPRLPQVRAEGVQKATGATRELMMLWRDNERDEVYRQDNASRAIGPAPMPVSDKYRELREVIEGHAFMATQIEFGPLFELPAADELESTYRNNYALPNAFYLQRSGPGVFLGNSPHLEEISFRVASGQKAGAVLECFMSAKLPKLKTLDLSGWRIDSSQFDLLRGAQITSLRSFTCEGRGLVHCTFDGFFDFVAQQKDLRNLSIKLRVEKEVLARFLARGHATLEVMSFADMTVLNKVSGQREGDETWQVLPRSQAAKMLAATRNKDLFPQMKHCYIMLYDSKWPAPSADLTTLALTSLLVLVCAYLMKRAVDGLLYYAGSPV